MASEGDQSKRWNTGNNEKALIERNNNKASVLIERNYNEKHNGHNKEYKLPNVPCAILSMTKGLQRARPKEP
eukprot:7628201-Ditylum_brightwellii.AAC.1